MKYTLEESKLEKVTLSEDNLILKLDYTLNVLATDGELSFPISEGCTIELPCPAELVAGSELAITNYFSRKYVNK